MTYSIYLEHQLEKKLAKLRNKDKKTNERVIHKMIELSRNPYEGKPLRRVMKGKWRVHNDRAAYGAAKIDLISRISLDLRYWLRQRQPIKSFRGLPGKEIENPFETSA